MKKLAVFLLVVMIGFETMDAQYKIDKTKYDYKTWTYQEGDPYNPAVCAVLSIIPGVGQMVAQESGRGKAFLAGGGGCLLMFAVGAGLLQNATMDDDLRLAFGFGLIEASILMMIGVDIWSIIDATRVAKVNNLAWRDKNISGFKFRLEPYISPVKISGYTNTQVGLSLKISF